MEFGDLYNPNKYPNPWLLSHANVPKPLHGLVPRQILGQAWWDVVRKAAAEKHQQHCWACGIHRSQGVLTKWLDGHEVYLYDYNTCTGEMQFVSSLCRMCHNFIHSGRQVVEWSKGKISWGQLMATLYHGFMIQKNGNVPPNPFAIVNYKSAYAHAINYGLKIEIPKWHEALVEKLPDAYNALEEIDEQMEDTPWEKWRLIIDGQRYPSMFGSEEEWDDYYNGDIREKYNPNVDEGDK